MSVQSISNKQWWFKGCFCTLLAISVAFAIRMLEWPCWQNPEFRLGNEMLLATHDAYHWLAGAENYGLAASHPMSIMLRMISSATGIAPANVAFWFPAVLAALVAGITQIWGWALGNMSAGIAAGLIASIAPGFLGRTLLGYYDTDLVTLFFPLVISIVPACWAMRHMLLPGMILGHITNNTGLISASFRHFKKTTPFIFQPAQGNPLGKGSIILLAISGILSWWTQEWHSVFPYLIRYNVILLAIMALVMSPKGRRSTLLLGSLIYALPALGGLWGLLLAGFLIFIPSRYIYKIPCQTLLVGLLWLLALWLIVRGDILNTLINHANAYLKHSGDTHATGATSLVFPSVAQSIIEVQDLEISALFSYFHPWYEASLLGLTGFGVLVFKRPGALFLLPLAVLGLLSARLGGRMVMFAAPVVALGIAIPAFWILYRFLGKYRKYSGRLSLLLCFFLFVMPFLDLIPALSQGPSINRRHAAALAEARSITPEDSTLWLWWDWGYAAHYFSRRQTIADGARHGGPSLYLPAAVFATDNPRFARQIIRYTSARDNEPGNFFKDMTAETAQELINKLRSSTTPLVNGKGRQFIITSFEMLRLGFWISNYGNWNFVQRQGGGGAMAIVPDALSYRLKTGEVKMMNNGNESIVFPSSITIFEETGVVKRNYIQEWFDSHPDATPKEQEDWLATRRNINFLFNKITDEKLIVDEGIYKSLMVQLLLCDAHDPRFSPYFKLVYDNVFARIYEVLGAPEESQ